MAKLVLVLLVFLTITPAVPAVEPDLRTVAESSGYEATATHAQVIDLLSRLEAAGPRMHVQQMGQSFLGKSLPMAIVADPPVSTPAQARASGKPVMLVFGNIHAGEVCGKEALLMLARELVTTDDHPLLRDLIFLFVPILNADGNDRMDPDNRPGQVGPHTMGERPNAQGLDLNRDWMKLESPELRSLVRVLTEWDPHVTIDTHTTNGSQHRYVLTYAAPLNPSGHSPSIEFVRDELLPSVTTRLSARTGYDTFWYGNFDRSHRTWSTYSANPRFGGPYRGLRGQMSILSEAYAYAPYRDRVLATLEFVREIASYVAEHGARIRALRDQARRDVRRAGETLLPSDCVGIRHTLAAFSDPVSVHGYELAPDEEGRPRPTDVPHDHVVVHRGRFESTVCVRRPFAYVIPSNQARALDTVRAHGIEVEPFAGAARTERYSITAVRRSDRPFQGHALVSVDVESDRATEQFAPGSWLVRTAQPLGTLVVSLLEPQAADGVATWGIVEVEEGAVFPVRRVNHGADVE